MGVFSGGADRSIGQNSPFLDGTTPTQRGNDVAATVATSALQCAASLDADSVRRAVQQNMQFFGALLYA